MRTLLVISGFSFLAVGLAFAGPHDGTYSGVVQVTGGADTGFCGKSGKSRLVVKDGGIIYKINGGLPWYISVADDGTINQSHRTRAGGGLSLTFQGKVSAGKLEADLERTDGCRRHFSLSKEE